MTGGLQHREDDGDDGLCAECRAEPAVGPCAACESMICGDCGVVTRDPSGTRVICLSCARLIAQVNARTPSRAQRPPLVRVIAVAVAIAFAAVVATLLWGGCGPHREPRAADHPPAAVTALPPDAAATSPVDAGAPDAAPPKRQLIVVAPPAGSGGLDGDPVVAARIFVFADTQLHYMFGKRGFAQSPFAERSSVEVAVRPAAQDDGADLLLGLFLDEWRNIYPSHELAFLGDASDLSCDQEFEAFTEVARRAGAERFLAITSNHDGFYVGNYTSRKDLQGFMEATDMPHDWTRACSEPGETTDHRLTKGRAVARLEALLPEAPSWATSSSYANAEGPDDYARTHLYFVRRLKGGDAGAPPVWGVFLDTVDYEGFDLHHTKGAGTVGAVSHQQLRFLDRAMFEARASSGKGPVTFVLFGHHPFDDFEKASRKRLLRFLEVRPEVIAYVSAHTHISIDRKIDLPDGRSIPEIVTGSTTDSPQAARLLEVQIEPAQNRRAVASWRLMVDEKRLCALIEPQPYTTMGYTGYRILRDGTRNIDVSAIEGILFKLGLENLKRERLVQALGALIVENELVRSWARLYLDSPLPIAGLARAELEGVVSRRYAAGDDFAALRPWLQGRAKPEKITAYDAWNDPVVAGEMRVAQQGVHRFGPHAATFRALHALRTIDPEAKRYFLCHALYAAAAEGRRPRRSGKILYIR